MTAPSPRVGSTTAAGGRRIGWVEHGPADGVPVLYCHGSPGAPAEIEQFHGERLATELGIRLVAIARPGIWRSDRRPGRRISDWAVDAAAVADATGIGSFGLLGYSAGAAYAAAAAAAMPERVTGVVLVAPVDHGDPGLAAGLDRPSLWAQRQTLVRPRLTRAVMSGTLRTPWRPALRLILRRTPVLKPSDHRALRDRDVLESVIRKAEEAFVGGVAGPQEDMALMMQPWGFDPATVRSPVWIWQGLHDTLGATVAMATSLHRRIEGSRLVLVDGGHLSTMTDPAVDILTTARDGERAHVAPS